jgi:hypothetical protein
MEKSPGVVVHCVTDNFSCIEYHDVPAPCGQWVADGGCGTPPDPANDICVIGPGIIQFVYPMLVPYPGVDGGFVRIGGNPYPECQRP